METTIMINENPHSVEEGTRLVNAIEDLGYDISHRCGGQAQCTSCRVEFTEGAPPEWTEAEEKALKKFNVTSARLSCQCLVAKGMNVKVLMPVSAAEWDEAGPRPTDHIEPVGGLDFSHSTN